MICDVIYNLYHILFSDLCEKWKEMDIGVFKFFNTSNFVLYFNEV